MYNALIDLMVQFPFDEISICQICQEAQVGRASFYRNYKSKKDILEKYMNALINEWGKEFEECMTDFTCTILKNAIDSELLGS